MRNEILFVVGESKADAVKVSVNDGEATQSAVKSPASPKMYGNVEDIAVQDAIR
jgi:hypothetical protein